MNCTYTSQGFLYCPTNINKNINKNTNNNQYDHYNIIEGFRVAPSVKKYPDFDTCTNCTIPNCPDDAVTCSLNCTCSRCENNIIINRPIKNIINNPKIKPSQKYYCGGDKYEDVKCTDDQYLSLKCKTNN